MWVNLCSSSLPKHIHKQADLEVFSKHAEEQFFEKEYYVGNKVEVKLDAQVMLLWNLESKLANRSRGIVRGFIPSAFYYDVVDTLATQSYTIDAFDEGEKKHRESQKEILLRYMGFCDC